MWAKLSLRLLFREFRRGELTLILLSIILAVASVFSLSLFGEKLRDALTEQSSQFLAADRVLSSSRSISESLYKNSDYDFSYSEQMRFSSMLYFKDDMAIVNVKAVDDFYPLKGDVKISLQLNDSGQVSSLPIQKGDIWLDGRIVQSLNLSIGDTVEIGDAKFIFAQILVTSPDRSMSIFASSPEIIIHLDDVEKTGIIQPGSRVSYQVKILGNESAFSSYEDWLLPKLNRDIHRWDSVKTMSTNIGSGVRKAENYLLLASLLSIILASIAIGVAAKRYAERHFDVVAILKTYGASKKVILKIFFLHLSMVVLFGIIAGLLLGHFSQLIVFEMLAEQLIVVNSPVSLRPFILAIVTGLICATFFSVVPMFSLVEISPLRVLRRELNTSSKRQIINFVLVSLAIYLLMYIYSGDLKLSSVLFLSVSLVVGLLFVISKFSFWGGRKVGSQAGSAIKLALARIQRRASENSIQLISFTLAIQLLLIVLILRSDLIGQWRNQLEPGTPNYFVVNLPSVQVDSFKHDFKKQGIELGDVYPITRGRLTAVNGVKLQDKVSKEAKPKSTNEGQERGPRMSIGRELSLTAHHVLPEDNEIIKGKWLTETKEVFEVSIEAGVAERLNIQLFDELEFDIGGIKLTVPVTSIRKVKWENMSANFFMIFSEDVLSQFSSSYLASMYINKEQQMLLHQLMSPYSSSNLIDLNAIIDQLRIITKQTSLAVEFIFFIVLLAGSLVMIAQVHASMAERKQEVAVLRTLGAKLTLIRASIIWEFIVLGGFAGVLAIASTEIAMWNLQTWVLKMPWHFHWPLWLLSPFVGSLVLASIGGVSCRSLLVNTVKSQQS